MGNPLDNLKTADRIEITTIIDNYTDSLLKGSEIVTRGPHIIGDTISGDTLVAEHGLCLMVSVYSNGEKKSILFDAGYSKIGVLHNVEYLGIDLNDIDTIVVSHRHMDHTAGIYALLDRMSGPISLVAHPEAFLADRFLRQDDGKFIRFPRTLAEDRLKNYDVNILESGAPLMIEGGRIGVTGEVERTTAFETGMPNAFFQKDGQMEKDPVLDDQALILHLEGKGLVVISGCSHSGIVNTVRYAMKLTGVQRLHAVLGGFHLGGPAYEPIVADTVSALQEMSPEVIVPMHCTGWSSIHKFAEAFPSSFILNSVGSRYTLQ